MATIILLLTTIPVTKGTNGTTVFIDPLSKTVEINQTFEMNLSVFNVTNLYSFEFKLRYNTSILDATNVNLGPFLNEPTFIFEEEINDTSGLVWYMVSSMSPANPADGSGTLAELTFKATGIGNTTLYFNMSGLGDFSLPPQPIDHTTNNATVTVTQVQSVGGIQLPVNKPLLILHLFAFKVLPYIVLTLIAMVSVIIFVKHKKGKG